MSNDPSGADPQNDAQTQFSYMLAMEKLRQELADMARKALLEQYPFYDGPLDPTAAATYFGMQQEAERQKEAALLAAARNGDMNAAREYARMKGDLVEVNLNTTYAYSVLSPDRDYTDDTGSTWTVVETITLTQKQQQTQGNGRGDSKNPYDGHSISVSGSLAFGGGINFSFGFVWNKEGDWRFFVSGGSSVGFDASIGFAIKGITNVNRNKPFNPNQYGGPGSSHNFGIGMIDIVPIGGDNYPAHFTGTMGASYTEGGGGLSYGVPLGYTYQMATTWFPGDWFK